MKQFATLFKQDLTLAWRNGFFLVVAVLLIIFIPVINFAIPDQMKMGAQEYVVDATEGRLLTSFLTEEVDAKWILDSESEAIKKVQDSKTAIAVIFKGNRDNPQIDILHQGNEPPKAIRDLEATLDRTWTAAGVIEGGESVHQKVVLNPGVEKPPFNKTFMPLVVATDPVFLGILFAAVMVFKEKAEGSIKAYRVTPGGTWPYILSKALVNVLLAIAYSLVLVIATVGFSANLVEVTILVGLTSFLMTIIGLLFSAFFDNISEFIFPYVCLIGFLGIPVVSYFFPMFKLPIFTYLPTYPIMFGLRESILPTGKVNYFLPLITPFIVESIVATILCKWVVGKRLMKEAH